MAPDGRPTEIGDYPDALAECMLCDIPHLLSGEIRHIEFLDCPNELIFIPWGNEITIFLYTQLTDSYVNWQQITVPTGAWFSAVIEATRQYIGEASNAEYEPVWTTLEQIQYLLGFIEKRLRVQGYLDHRDDAPC